MGRRVHRLAWPMKRVRLKRLHERAGGGDKSHESICDDKRRDIKTRHKSACIMCNRAKHKIENNNIDCITIHRLLTLRCRITRQFRDEESCD